MAWCDTLQYLRQKILQKQVHNMAENTLQSEQGVRFEQIINRLDLTQVAVGELVGLSQSYISQMITGARPISKKILQFIAKSHPQVNLEWLLTGNGEMIKPNRVDEVNEPTPIYGPGILESLIQQMKEMDARLKALEKSQTKS